MRILSAMWSHFWIFFFMSFACVVFPLWVILIHGWLEAET